MTPSVSDEISEFYERHPYPPPVDDLDHVAAESGGEERRRVEHFRRWPTTPFRDDHSILVAGCGTSQAARHALRNPSARVVGIDVSRAGVERTRRLADHHGLENLEVRELPIEHADELGRTFDHIVCTGVIHHLADPGAGLRALRGVLSPVGVLDLMVYAPYGRTGIYMLQEYCRRLGVSTSSSDIADLKTSLRELPLAHPVSHLLRDTPDFRDDDALADALLNPRDRAYCVPQVLDLLGNAGLEFGRWIHQAPYLPTCGAPATVPHRHRIAALAASEQHAALELYRGTMTRHSLLARRDDAPGDAQPVRFDNGSSWSELLPIRPSTVMVVDERLPAGAAAAVLNRAHEHADLVCFVGEEERQQFEAIDGHRRAGEIGADQEALQRWWDHDLIVIDASGPAA